MWLRATTPPPSRPERFRRWHRPKGPPWAWIGAASQQGARLVILRETALLKGAGARSSSGRPSFALAGAEARPSRTLVVVPAALYDRMAAGAVTGAVWDPGQAEVEQTVTTNAVGWLPGTDPAAGVLLISAHLDHLGVRPDGVILHGANDDASGTTAVLELARALSTGEPHRRGILFVAYGSEEVGGLGSSWFGDHPPVPLTDIVANLEIEMIGAQDPQMADGVMMMTGFDRSDFGAALRDKGALIAPAISSGAEFSRTVRQLPAGPARRGRPHHLGLGRDRDLSFGRGHQCQSGHPLHDPRHPVAGRAATLGWPTVILYRPGPRADSHNPARS